MKLQQEYCISPLKRIVRSITTYTVALEPDKSIFEKQFTTDAYSLSDVEKQELSRVIDANRVTVPIYEVLSELASPVARELKAHLKSNFHMIIELERHRDTLLRRLVYVLNTADIDYAVFKTLNRLGSVGVDIDIVINLSNYDRCVKALLVNGFFPIDDLSKKYATGFMVRGNPVIVDLHTELAVLGVRYMSSDSLLRRKRSITFQPCNCSEQFSLNVLDGTTDALVRMVHCVLKEGTIKIDDAAEVLPVFQDNADLLIDCVNEESLRLAVSIFSYIAVHSLGAEQFRRLIMFNDDFTHNFVKNILSKSILDSPIPPFKLSVAICMLAFIDCLKRRRELGKYTPLFIYSLKFRRNAEHLGHKILCQLSASVK